MEIFGALTSHTNDDVNWESRCFHKDPLYIDDESPLWFPPGAKLRLVGDHTTPHKHFCAPPPDPAFPLGIKSCSFKLTEADVIYWVSTLVAYPSYLHFVVQKDDSVRSIASKHAHVIQGLTPPRKSSTCPRLNLATLARMTAYQRFHALLNSVKPAPWGYDTLTIRLLADLPRNETEAHFQRQQGGDALIFTADELVKQVAHCYSKTKLASQRWTLCASTATTVNLQNNQIRQWETPDLALVFDLVCNWLLTNDEFDVCFPCDFFKDNEDTEPERVLGYKHEITKDSSYISKFIPWTMIVRYMDRTMFLNATTSWFQHRHICAWNFLVEFNFWNVPQSSGSQMPHVATIMFYREIIKKKFIFAVDIQAHLHMIDSRYKFTYAIRDPHGRLILYDTHDNPSGTNGMVATKTLSQEARQFYNQFSEEFYF